jgi:hypothetical protein
MGRTLAKRLGKMDTTGIEEKGLEIYYGSKWVGEPGVDRREIVLKDWVRDINLPLTPEEWCSLCMRHGDHYIGGCCGQTGYIQDHFNAVFRDSGQIHSQDFLRLAATASRHEGFELFQDDLTQSQFDEKLSEWDSLGPIDKIGLCFQAVKSKLRDKDIPKSGVDLENPKDVIHILNRGLNFLSWEDIFTRDEKQATGQVHGNTELHLAKILPAAHKLLAALETRTKPFEGFGIFLKSDPNQILDNRLGCCVYHTHEEAQKIVDLWTKPSQDEEDETEDASRFEIKPLTISMQEGLKIG